MAASLFPCPARRRCRWPGSHLRDALPGGDCPRATPASRPASRGAGTYGKDTRASSGPPVDKVECSLTPPRHELGRARSPAGVEESIVGGLVLSYRGLAVAAGDLGNLPSAIYDNSRSSAFGGPLKTRYLTSASNSTKPDYSDAASGPRLRARRAPSRPHPERTACAVGRTLLFVRSINQYEASPWFVAPTSLRPFACLRPGGAPVLSGQYDWAQTAVPFRFTILAGLR